jgi:hypothetical protein
MTGTKTGAVLGTTCLNCGTALSGPFCATCGQRDVPPHPTLRELAGDTWNELIGWDGKLARTLDTMFRHPGELTRAVLEGQRVRYVSPVRLYLACSLLYFVLAAAAPLPEFEFEVGFSAGVGTGSSGSNTPGKAAFGKAVAQGIATLTAEERAAAEAEIASQPRLFRPWMRAMAADFAGLQRRTYEILPRALFVLMPALAGILGLFYRRRPYPDHLYFAIHLQAFAFLMMTMPVIVQYTGSITGLAVTQACAYMTTAVYLVVAARRVYGGGWLENFAKALGVVVLYVSIWSITGVSAGLWVSRTA